MTIAWNPVLRARAGEPVLRNLAATGGRSPTGREQRVVSDAGFWAVPITGLVINTSDKAAAYRAMIARLRQGEELVFPLCQIYVPPGARDLGSSATLASSADLRDSRIDLFVTGFEPSAGFFCTIGERLHLITEVLVRPGQDPDNSPWLSDPVSPWAADEQPWIETRPDASWSVRIVPPLRAAVSAGAAVSFTQLRLRCVVQDLADGDLALDLGRFGTPSLTLIESL